MMSTTTDLNRWKAARHTAAQLVLMDRIYAPIFERVEREIAALEAEQELVERARAIVHSQRAIG
ncbi:MAG: hypothetical protein CL945_10345 [Dinoroseobacter sp.]|nr:hypothetical protein [Dinoroseobacter sp.]|tara:strand:+ start:144 stop:335 length:192 start_codon:yes stop_codon:yes gene_type:complete